MVNWPTKKLDKEKPSVYPDWKESEFAKTIDGQIMLMVEKALKNDHFIEAQTLSWASIEQLLLPRLIGWVAKTLKLSLPKEIYKLNNKNINFIYLSLSHDVDLYRKLEQCRKQRNKIIHKLISMGNIESISKLALEYTESNIKLQEEIMKRFSGAVLIPSINLYKDGWNDCRKETIKRIEEMKDKLIRS